MTVVVIHPTQIFPGPRGIWITFRAKLWPLQSQGAHFASNSCSEGLLPYVWTCMCACSGSRAYRLRWCPAARGPTGWHFQRGAKSLAHWSGEETRHVGTFVCELRNTETQAASQIPPTNRLWGINNTHPYTHSRPATDQNDQKQSFYPGRCWKNMPLHAKCLDRKSPKSTVSPFPCCMHAVHAVHWVHVNVGVKSGLW